MKTLNEWLTEQEKLCQEAIPGPWEKTHESGDGKWFAIEGQPDEWERLACRVETDDCDEMAAKRTGEFIIASRLSLPTAIEIIRALIAKEEGDYDLYPDDIKSIAERIINQQQ